MSIRTNKVASVLQKDLAGILYSYQNNNMITVTDVWVSPDLGLAKVYISIMGGGSPEQAFAFLKDHESDIRYKLSKKIRHQLRRMPEIDLQLDSSAEYANKMDEIFKKITKDNPDQI